MKKLKLDKAPDVDIKRAVAELKLRKQTLESKVQIVNIFIYCISCTYFVYTNQFCLNKVYIVVIIFIRISVQ